MKNRKYALVYASGFVPANEKQLWMNLANKIEIQYSC